MHVANLELCKELYDLSGWDKSLLYWQIGIRKLGTSNIRDYKTKMLDTTKTIPGYNLGYLLRELPVRTVIYHSADDYVAKYSALVEKNLPIKYEERANNPEDAICKLAIKLFKQKILIKEII